MYREVVGHPLLSARQIFLLCGVLTIPVLIYIVVLIPAGDDPLPGVAAHAHVLPGARARQAAICPRKARRCSRPTTSRGSTACCWSPSRRGRCGSSSRNNLLSSWWAQGLARIMGAIPLRRGPKAVRSALDTARDALNAGEIVCIFPEGDITRSGQLQTFKPGRARKSSRAPTPRSCRSTSTSCGAVSSASRGGKFFWKWPGPGGRRVSIWFGEPLEQPENVYEVRNAVQALGAEAVTGRKHAHDGAAAH